MCAAAGRVIVWLKAMDVRLPDSWSPLSRDEAQAVEKELRRELPPAHQLQDHQLIALARYRRDDILFRSQDDQGPVFCVHLTWSVETDPAWPWTESYKDMGDFLERWPREQLDDSGEDDGC